MDDSIAILTSNIDKKKKRWEGLNIYLSERKKYRFDEIQHEANRLKKEVGCLSYALSLLVAAKNKGGV